MTIEERAEERTQESDIWFEKTSFEFGYIEGATDQQAIDIDKAIDWLKRELADPMPEDLYQQWCDEKLADFRKAMADSK